MEDLDDGAVLRQGYHLSPFLVLLVGDVLCSLGDKGRSSFVIVQGFSAHGFGR